MQLDTLQRTDATDADWLVARAPLPAIESFVQWRLDSPQYVGPVWEDLAWDMVRHFPDTSDPPDLFRTMMGWDAPARAEYVGEVWDDAWSRDEPGPYDRLLIAEMGNARRAGWKAPGELDAIFAALDSAAARSRAKCNRVFGDVVRAEFAAAQIRARSNPQWWTADNLIEAMPAIQKVIDTKATPPADIIVSFVHLVNELDTKDDADKEFASMLENVAAGATTLEQQIRRGAADMDHMKDFARNVRTQEPEPNNPDNVGFLLRSLALELRWNDWLERMEIRGESPFLKNELQMQWPEWTYVDDSVVAMLRTFAARTHSRFCPGKDFTWDTMESIARKNVVDPAIDLLSELGTAWDGAPRLDSWLSRACGTPADAYHAAVGRNIIGGMVKRMRHPGAKHDEIALFVGQEGTGKSTLIAALAPRPEWFTESIRLGDEPKELVLSLAGKAVAEISEMSASTKDVAAIKAMISRTTDAGRTAYARSVTERPRRNIFIASTNDDTALVADTGNRRFLPVRIEQAIDLVWLRTNIPALIGEAAVLEADGETFALPREVWGEAAERQEASRQVAEYELHLVEWFAPSPLALYVTAADLSDLVKSAAGRSVNAKGYTKAMRRLGFVKATKRVDGKPAAVWHRGDLALATRIIPSQVGNRVLARIGYPVPVLPPPPPVPVVTVPPPPV